MYDYQLLYLLNRNFADIAAGGGGGVEGENGPGGNGYGLISCGFGRGAGARTAFFGATPMHPVRQLLPTFAPRFPSSGAGQARRFHGIPDANQRSAVG
jgi:hypothetical protein